MTSTFISSLIHTVVIHADIYTSHSFQHKYNLDSAQRVCELEVLLSRLNFRLRLLILALWASANFRNTENKTIKICRVLPLMFQPRTNDEWTAFHIDKLVIGETLFTNRWPTSISLEKVLPTTALLTFIAALTNPVSGVHSSGVNTTPHSNSEPFRPFLVPTSLHALSTMCWTYESWQRVERSAPLMWFIAEPWESERAWRRLGSWGNKIATGFVAPGTTCTQIFET